MQPSFQEMCGPQNWWLEPRTCGWNLKEEDTNLVVRVQGFPFVSLERLVIFLYLEWQGQPPPPKETSVGSYRYKIYHFLTQKNHSMLRFQTHGIHGTGIFTKPNVGTCTSPMDPNGKGSLTFPKSLRLEKGPFTPSLPRSLSLPWWCGANHRSCWNQRNPR